MEILAAVTARLSALGYTVTEADSAALDYNIKKYIKEAFTKFVAILNAKTEGGTKNE